jgi:hypothetical protein
MRRVLTLAACALFAAAAMADDKRQERERRVRVALALAATSEPKAVAAADCGKCREDAVAARLDGLKENRPVVLFVGGCPGEPMADAVCKSGGIPAKLAEYDDGGEHPKAEKRVVVLEPKPDRTGFYRITLPATTPAKELEAAVKASVPKAVVPGPTVVQPVPLNWQF